MAPDLLGTAWVLVGLLFFRRALAGRGSAWLGTAAATALAGFALGRWHVMLLGWARDVLRAQGAYADRSLHKAALAAALAAALLVAVLTVARWTRRGERLPLVAALGALTYVLAQTAFLDDLVPPVLARGAGRYAIEGAFVVLVLVGLMRPRRRADGGGS